MARLLYRQHFSDVPRVAQAMTIKLLETICTNSTGAKTSVHSDRQSRSRQTTCVPLTFIVGPNPPTAQMATLGKPITITFSGKGPPACKMSTGLPTCFGFSP
ncbi:hypothetical protein J2Z50_006423 [Ensifer mexicanus]|nr:hypothetical protein [Sinorhizobium mexicanum]